MAGRKPDNAAYWTAAGDVDAHDHSATGMTVAFWITRTNNVNGAICGKYNIATTRGWVMEQTAAGVLDCYLIGGAWPGPVLQCRPAASALAIGARTHVAWGVLGAATVATSRIWIDGAAVALAAGLDGFPGAPAAANVDTLRIGRESTPPTYDGGIFTIDDLRIYSRQLATDEVQDIRAQGGRDQIRLGLVDRWVCSPAGVLVSQHGTGDLAKVGNAAWIAGELRVP